MLKGDGHVVIQPLDTTDNKLIRHVRRLLSSGHTRDKAQETVVEGPRVIRQAVEAGAKLRTVLYSTRFMTNDRGRALVELLSAGRARMVYVSDRLLEELSDVEHNQGIMAVVRYVVPQSNLLPAPSSGTLLGVVAQEIQDPGNLGSLVRAAMAAGAHSVGTTLGTVDALNPKTVRASAGSVFGLPVVSLTEDWLDAERLVGVTVRSAVVGGGVPYDQVDWRKPAILVVGNEGRGLDNGFVAQTEAVTIPMADSANSLNVSMAAAVILFHAALQRRQHRPTY